MILSKNKTNAGMLAACLLCAAAVAQPPQATYCNPLNLNYRFAYGAVSYREAADPVIHLYKGRYFLYASKSGGYWHSDDLLNWKFRPSAVLPAEDYAPTAETIHDTVFFMASKGQQKIYYNTNPQEDTWEVYNPRFPLSVTDPALFKDSDGRVYFYYGCSNKEPLFGIELNPSRRLDTIGSPRVLIEHQYQKHGWEEPGETNRDGKNGWNEGSWMTKYNGKYYLQYAAPGTEFKGYGDGVYVSDKPLGPFAYMNNSPFSYKPGGFINGAGHGNTFQDKYGNYWHAATMTISVRHMFERRLGLFPAFFDGAGELLCLKIFVNYPAVLPNRKMNFEKESLFAGWMLLSYQKPTAASSALANHSPNLACDEEVRTWWSGVGGKDEWLQVDLLQSCAISALQVNFADEGSMLKAADKFKPYQYVVSVSSDGKKWKNLIDKSKNNRDITHDYIALPSATTARYVKINCLRVPDGKFSLSGFRIFGKGNGALPKAVENVSVKRETDSRRVALEWEPAEGAVGYAVYFGTERNKLFHSVMTYGKNTLDLPGLNQGVPYFFRVDSFNENGITTGK